MDPRDRTVASVMRAEFASVSSRDRLDLVDDVMKLGQVRHMPVIDDGELTGVVSQRDLLAASLSCALDFAGSQRRTFLRSVGVDEVMARNPVTANPDTPLGVAARAMLENRIGCLPVVDDKGRPVGLLTETDLVRGAYDLDEE